MLRFHAIASSSAGCCYRLSGGGAAAPLLLDAGIPFKAIQEGCGFQVTALAGALITHGHGDHGAAIPRLLDAGVDVFASFETLEPYRSSHRAKTLVDRQEARVGDWRVLPFAAVHDAPGTLGFLIASPDGSRAVYLTDSAYSPFRFQGLTHIFVECNYSDAILAANVERGSLHPDLARRIKQTHMSLERLIPMLLANDLSKVEEIHLLHLSAANSDEAAFKSAVQQATGVPTYIAAAFAGSRA